MTTHVSFFISRSFLEHMVTWPGYINRVLTHIRISYITLNTLLAG